MILLASVVTTESVGTSTFDGAAYALEIGGLFFLGAAVVSILVGIAWGGDENASGGRAVGYGVAMAAAAGLSLYLSSTLGGDPMTTASQARWMYPLLAIVGCLLYVSRAVNQSTRGHGRNMKARSQAVDELYRSAGSRGVQASRRAPSRDRSRSHGEHGYGERP